MHTICYESKYLQEKKRKRYTFDEGQVVSMKSTT